MIQQHPAIGLPLHDLDAGPLMPRDQHEVGALDVQHALRIERAGFWIAIALLRIHLAEQEVEVRVEHGLRIARAATAIDLHQDSRLTCFVRAKGGQGVLGPVERADHFAGQLLAGDEFKCETG